MAKFIIAWSAGYGSMKDIIEADSQAEAEECAYEEWKQAAESEADYGAVPYTQDLAIRLGLEDEPAEVPA